MHTSVFHPTGRLGPRAVALALAAVLVGSLPVAAFNAGWTSPKRVFATSSAPTHAMVTDEVGAVHIATERGSTGVWYVTNKNGPWEACQVSGGDDRGPSIAVEGGVVHVAFARRTAGQQGAYTASSDQPAPSVGCGWAVTKRAGGSVKDTALGAYGGTLSLLFRTGTRKLRFYKGAASSSSWSLKETVDGGCCTAPPALELTTKGAPRVAYGDGTSTPRGLKYAVRKATGWKKLKVSGGRVRHVSMTLDRLPGLFGGEPSNRPTLAFVLKRKGLFVSFRSGKHWSTRGFGRASGPVDIASYSNVTQLVFARSGDLEHLRFSGGIWFGTKLSRSGNDVKLQYDGRTLTFGKKAGKRGIYYTRPT